MSLFKKKEKTAKQKAQQAQLRIVVRLVCCAYIVMYIIMPTLQPPPDEPPLDPTMRIGILVFFSIAVAIVLTLTTMEVFHNKKTGRYKADEASNPELPSGNEGDGETGIARDEKNGEADGDNVSDDFEDNEQADEFRDDEQDAPDEKGALDEDEIMDE